MAQAIATQHQNSQTKTFIAAFAGVLLAVPIVTVLTTAIVKAQLGTVTDTVLASMQPATSQQNTAAYDCEAPAEAQTSGENTATTSQGNSTSTGWYKSGSSVSGSYNQTNTSTTHVNNTKTITKTKVITKVISDSFNVGSNNGNFSNNGNTVDSNNGNFSNNNSGNTNNSNNGNFSNNGNTTNSNNDIGNTVNSGNAINSGNVVNSGNTINSNNTVNNDNDVIDIL